MVRQLLRTLSSGQIVSEASGVAMAGDQQPTVAMFGTAFKRLCANPLAAIRRLHGLNTGDPVFMPYRGLSCQPPKLLCGLKLHIKAASATSLHRRPARMRPCSAALPGPSEPRTGIVSCQTST